MGRFPSAALKARVQSSRGGPFGLLAQVNPCSRLPHPGRDRPDPPNRFLGKVAVTTVAETAGQIAGGWAGGALVGAVAGSEVPVAGTVVGAVIGGFIGGMAAGTIAESSMSDG